MLISNYKNNKNYEVMKLLFCIYAGLLIAIQYPLFFGKGSWKTVSEYEIELKKQQEITQKLQIRNDGLDAEVNDLKHGFSAIEERARNELNMVKQNEVFIALPSLENETEK